MERCGVHLQSPLRAEGTLLALGRESDKVGEIPIYLRVIAGPVPDCHNEAGTGVA